MAKVIGIGGIFFKCSDPASLAAWYQRWLGMAVDRDGTAVFYQEDQKKGQFAIWSTFDQDTDYFLPSNREFMINLVVDDLMMALAQVIEGGGRMIGEVKNYEYGKFACFLDPYGNKVELWEPS